MEKYTSHNKTNCRKHVESDFICGKGEKEGYRSVCLSV